ncbi:MAG: hypothetical protein AAF716_22230 [Cyanobacteria bacterium P01_D01_bin.1]
MGPVGEWIVQKWSAERRSLERRAARQRDNLRGEELTLWIGWSGLTWFAFLSSLLFIEVGERADLTVSEGLIGGGLIGLAQCLMLRPYMPGAYRWLVASLVSWGALAFFHVGVVGWMAPATLSLPLRGGFGFLQGAYVGVGLGVGQWLAMRRQVSIAWRWVPLSGVIWAVAIALGWLVGGGLRAISGLFVSEVIGLMVAWGAIASFSGLGMVMLLRVKDEG